MQVSRFVWGAALAALVLAPSAVEAATVAINPPTANRWMYPFGLADGTRASASIFGAVGAGTFDERDAQYLVAFDTATAGVPTGLGASSYLINSVTLSFSVQAPGGAGDSTFVYDPTYDAFGTYDSDPDTDAGRPIEVYGIGFRNGYTQFGLAGPSPPNFTVNTNFSPPGPPAAGVRNAYALGSNGSSLVDVSNNVGLNGLNAGFDPTPLAVATTALAPGAAVTHNTLFTADLLLSDPLYLAYLQDALNDGLLGLAVTSMHEAVFGGSATYPIINTINTVGIADGLKPSLTIDYTIVPEPSTWALLGLGLLGLAPWLRKRAR